MQYQDLRDFIEKLEKKQLLKRISHSISPNIEMTAICDRTLKKNGPALLFENPTGFSIPVLGNLFGSQERIILGLGRNSVSELREFGKFLALFKSPEPPKGFRDALANLPMYKQILNMAPKITNKAPVYENILTKEEIDLYKLPIQKCWPEDAGPLITWGLVTTKSPSQHRQNLGIYRQQVLDKNKTIIRWLKHRGGAIDYQIFRKTYPDKPFPVAVSLGCDPSTILSAVMPIPDQISEYSFAGLLRGQKTLLTKCLTVDLLVPAKAEIILEGFIYPNDEALEGPFGDHTGYYNDVEKFPVFTIETMALRNSPIYHSTYTGRPPDEPSMLGLTLNELFIPLIQQQFPEITDFYLPPEGCSYRIAVVTIKKQYPGHARQIMLGIWSFLKQFMYTKWIIVCDDDINARNWQDVMWAISTRMDPKRDTMLLENTPIDYLDFASEKSNIGSKMGFDATNKIGNETTRAWGKKIQQQIDVTKKIEQMWEELNIC